jgi:hypothetical protein
MSKKISLVDIKKDVKKYDQQKRIDLNEDTFVVIYPHFSPSKMAELIKEMVTDKLRAEEAGIDFDKVNMSDWFLFNIIYKFADLGIPSKIEKKVQAFNVLIDWEYFGQVIEAFPQESIKAFEKAFLQFKDNLDVILDNKELVNDEVLDGLLKQEELSE